MWVGAKHFVQLTSQTLQRSRAPHQLVKGPLHQDARGVVPGEQESSESVTRLLENLRGEVPDVLQAECHGAARGGLALGFLAELFPDQILQNAIQLLGARVQFPISPPLRQDCRMLPGEECLLALAVRGQDGALLPWDLRLEVLVEGDDSCAAETSADCGGGHRGPASGHGRGLVFTNYVEGQVCGKLPKPELFSRFGVAIQMVEEALRLLQHGRCQGEKMLRRKAAYHSLSQVFPFFALSCQTVAVSPGLCPITYAWLEPAFHGHRGGHYLHPSSPKNAPRQADSSSSFPASLGYWWETASWAW